MRGGAAPFPLVSLQVHAGQYVVSAGLSSLDDADHTASVTVNASYSPPPLYT